MTIKHTDFASTTKEDDAHRVLREIANKNWWKLNETCVERVRTLQKSKPNTHWPTNIGLQINPITQRTNRHTWRHPVISSDENWPPFKTILNDPESSKRRRSIAFCVHKVPLNAAFIKKMRIHEPCVAHSPSFEQIKCGKKESLKKFSFALRTSLPVCSVR